jgi:hypothetical protein
MPHDGAVPNSYVDLTTIAIWEWEEQGSRTMSKASKQSTPITTDMEVVEDRTCDLDGFTVNFVTIRTDFDLAPMLASLPEGKCQCPHWGVLTKGRMTVTYADHQEVIEAGDAFYMTPGHTPAVVAGTEFVQFSPADLLAETEAAITKAMQDAAN